MTTTDLDILTERRGAIGLITLNRPQALNALSLPMVRAITATLQAWREDPQVQAVVFAGASRPGKAPAFCAGGDIRFFHRAACADDPALGEFFTEEYALDHLIHRYPKPTVVLMDGIVMGGGMGLAQGCSLRVATERAKLAMPETMIGLFPDVGGGWFLSRCPGAVGEYLGLTGQAIGAERAIAWGLADQHITAAALPAFVDALAGLDDAAALPAIAAAHAAEAPPAHDEALDQPVIEFHFGRPSVADIVASLERQDEPLLQTAAAALRQRSPLMLAVTLEQIRRARDMSLADELRMERDMVHHSFHRGAAGTGDTVEGIRALAIDKDHQPRWSDASIETVDARQVAAFFESPWTVETHPLRALSDPSPGG